MAAKVNCMVVHGGVLCKGKHTEELLYTVAADLHVATYIKSFATVICDKWFLKWDSNS